MTLRSLGCTGLVFALLAIYGNTIAAQGQQTYTLNVASDNQSISLTLKAKGARLSEIAADLEKRLGTQVFLGPALQKETISESFAETGLESALMSLAPRVFVDYELRQDARPVPLGIYLLGVTDPAPPSDAVVRGTSQGVVIEGNTEDVAKDPKEDPLRVVGDRRFLTITSKAQPLALVARAIADVLGIPVDLKYDADELVSADVAGLPEDVIPRLSPNIRLYIRADVSHAERTPIKIEIERPAAK
jgi:hypothetical protein